MAAESGRSKRTRMLQRLLDSLFSLGFLKLVWDAIRFGWKRLYPERVTASIYIAYTAAAPATELEKKTFLVVRNGTGKPITIDMFIWETDSWHRCVRARRMHNLVLSKPIIDAPAKGTMQRGFSYAPGNLFFEGTGYFGVRLSTGTQVWVATRRWRRAFAEFKRDFRIGEITRKLLYQSSSKTTGARSSRLTAPQRAPRLRADLNFTRAKGESEVEQRELI